MAAEAKTTHQPKKKPVREATIVPMLTRGDLAGMIAPTEAWRKDAGKRLVDRSGDGLHSNARGP